MNNKKGFLISIIFLIVILLGLAGYGIYLKDTGFQIKIEAKPEEKNDNQVVLSKSLSLYNGFDELVGSYNCGDNTCEYPSVTSDDKYILDVYQEGTITTLNKTINNRYVFIKDKINNHNCIILYDVIKKEILYQYQAIKNYGVKIEKDIFIVQDENNYWGVISLNTSEVKQLINFKYDYIGLANYYDSVNQELLADKFAVLKNGEWAITDIGDVTLSSPINEAIKNYTGLYVITFVNGIYKIYDYSGNIIKGENNYINIKTTGKYIEFVTDDNKLFIYDGETSQTIGNTITLNGKDFTTNALFPPYETSLSENSIVVKVYTDQQYGTFKTYTFTT